MKPKPEEKTKEATCHPKQPHWHEMNRKQRLVRYGMKYVDQGAEFYEAQHPNRQSTISNGKLPSWDVKLSTPLQPKNVGRSFWGGANETSG